MVSIQQVAVALVSLTYSRRRQGTWGIWDGFWTKRGVTSLPPILPTMSLGRPQDSAGARDEGRRLTRGTFVALGEGFDYAGLGASREGAK